MFDEPQLRAGEVFPHLPYDDPVWIALMKHLKVQINPACPDDRLTQFTRYGVGWVERLPDYHDDLHDVRVTNSHLRRLLSVAGLVHEIDPKTPEHDYALVDGGNSIRYDIRLAKAKQLCSTGKLVAPHLVVFGGQCPRNNVVDGIDSLKLRVEASIDGFDSWARSWAADELSRTHSEDEKWLRPFPTERELAILSLYNLHRRGLQYAHAVPRLNAAEVRIHHSIPLASTAANVFTLNEEQLVTVLNAPARWREHAGRKLPVEEARPNGRSCFKEWLALHQPPGGSRVILLTHQPNIFRSWLDLIIKAAEEGRQDLRITAAGARLEAEATVGDVLEGLGNLIINNYNMLKEGGVDIPATTPFVMLRRCK